MKEQTIQQWAQIFGLSDTVCEACDYIEQHPENTVMPEELKLAIQTILNQLESLGKAAQPSLKKGFKLLSAPSLLTANVKKWCDTLQVTICSELLEEMKDITYLMRETTELIFEQISKCPRGGESAYANLIFQTAMRGRVYAPEICYLQMLHLMEQAPELLSNGGAHPGYIFRNSPQRIFECCPTCGCQDGTPYHMAFSYAMQNFSEPFLPAKLWIKCEKCGNLYTYQFPEAFLALSEHKELVQPSGIHPECISPTASAGILSIWSDILNLLKQYTDGMDVLEVGIGNGDFLSVALEMGYEPDAVEIELERAQKIADILNIPINCCDFLQFETEKRYDILMMGDVIEHVTEPEKALSKAYSLLKNDGVLWLSTPNFNSSFSRLRKFEDAMWKEPYHISYFSYEGLLPLIEKCGFHVLHYKVSNRYNGSMELVLGK